MSHTTPRHATPRHVGWSRRLQLGSATILRDFPSSMSASRLFAFAQDGAQLNVVFMDNDILVFRSLTRIFENEKFDYGCTISDSPVMPVCVLTCGSRSVGSPQGCTGGASAALHYDLQTHGCFKAIVAMP